MTISKIQNTCFKDDFDVFIKRWFSFAGDEQEQEHDQQEQENANSTLTDHSTSTSSLSECINPTTTTSTSTIASTRSDSRKAIDYEGMTRFFSWAFFDKMFHHLETWELKELDIMMNILRDKHGVVYPKRTRIETNTHSRTCSDGEEKKEHDHYQQQQQQQQQQKEKEQQQQQCWGTPRCHSLEEGNPMYRPFLFYAIVSFLRIVVAYSILRYLGYRRFYARCPSGKSLPYWYRPGSGSGHEHLRLHSHSHSHITANKNVKKNTSTNPVLFFHGIAPAGLACYLPLLINCLHAHGQRTISPVFLFENLPITYYLSFEALSEEETVYAVEHALLAHGFHKDNCDLSLFGHSFGSFQMTWLLHAVNIKPMIQKLVLLDPVSILLSHPDVLVNFIYGGGDGDGRGTENGITNTIIRVAASSEMFIQHYLRRNFAWYNSELWIEDIPDHTNVHVFLSENDSIIDAKEVRKELKRHQHKNEHKRKSIHYTFWEGHGHGDCLSNSALWCEVSKALNGYDKFD